MKWLRRLLATILALAIAATVIVMMLNATTWNQNYLETTARGMHLPDKLAAAVPDVVGQYVPEGPARTAVASAITPEYVAGQLHELIPEFVAAFRGDGALPLLNLTGLSEQLSALDIPIPGSLATVLNTPQPLVPDNLADPLKTAGQATGQMQWLAPLVALAAAVLIVLIAGRRRWLTLAGAVTTSAIVTALAALVVQLPPRLVGAALDSSPARPLAPAIRGFAQTIATNQTHRLLVIAAGLVAAAVILVVIHGVTALLLHHRARHPEPKETEASTLS